MQTARPAEPLRVAMAGTRGVPARYGGFETAVEEIGRRLVERGHHVVVYRRARDHESPAPVEHLGMELVTLPALPLRAAETLTHSALSTVHAIARTRPDVVFLFNVANAPLLPLLRARRIPVAVHVDGLEWQRAKWEGLGQRYYRAVESLAVRWADALIADAEGIAAYYRDELGASTELLRYGAPIVHERSTTLLAPMHLERDAYHLVVARFEPENHIDLIVRGYHASRASLPLVVVGSAPYSDAHTAAIHRAGAGDDRIRFVGAVWDQATLTQLYANARLYLHGHSVGGTNPSLLRAMGAATNVAAFDVRFNREVTGEPHASRWSFRDEADVARLVEAAEADQQQCRAEGDALQARAEERYRWDDVTSGYELLAQRLAAGWSRRGEVGGRRVKASA